MSETGPVRLEHDGPLAVLTVAAPPLNLFDQALIDALGQHVRALESHPPRGLLIRAEGRAVSGGVDVRLFDGLIPAMGGTQPLAERAGPARSRELVTSFLAVGPGEATYEGH